MRVVWSSLALLVLSSVAGAQAALTGYVRDDESLRGLPGVELSVDGATGRFVRTRKANTTCATWPPVRCECTCAWLDSRRSTRS